jgi:hypothetical protein
VYIFRRAGIGLHQYSFYMTSRMPTRAASRSLPLSGSRSDAVKMCHGHPHHHACGHQSVRWHYCPKAVIDLITGYETACDKTTFATSQLSKIDCPLQTCEFRAYGGSWTCCACGQGPNTQGWCAYSRPRWEENRETGDWAWVDACDHGCCRNCTATCELHLLIT